MAADTHRRVLVVKGVLEFHNDGRDSNIEQLLEGTHGEQDRLEIALQELEGAATDVTIELL